MNKGNLPTWILGGVAVLILIVGLIAQQLPEPLPPTDVWMCQTADDVERYVQSYSAQDITRVAGSIYLDAAPLWDTTARVEWRLDEDAVAHIAAICTLPSAAKESYTESEIQTMTQAFQTIKTKWETMLGCTVTRCDAIPTQEDVTDTVTDAAFLNGAYIREYSVRDSSGVLWLLRWAATPQSATVTVHKIIDMTGYEYFKPGVDRYRG